MIFYNLFMMIIFSIYYLLNYFKIIDNTLYFILIGIGIGITVFTNIHIKKKFIGKL